MDMSQNVHKGPGQTLCWVPWPSPWPAFHLPQCFPWEVTLALRKKFPHMVKCTLSPHSPSQRFNYSLLPSSVIFHFPTALPVTPVFYLHFASRLLSLRCSPFKTPHFCLYGGWVQFAVGFYLLHCGSWNLAAFNEYLALFLGGHSKNM